MGFIKDGCLLLNVGPRADGTIPLEAQNVLLAIGHWLEINGKAIYGTRPWKISGEGPTGTAEGHLSEGKNKPYTARDIQFTQDGKHLYATLLDWPKGGKAVITSLGTATDVGVKGIKSITLLGQKSPLTWSVGTQGLVVQLPDENVGKFAYVLRITPKGALILN